MISVIRKENVIVGNPEYKIEGTDNGQHKRGKYSIISWLFNWIAYGNDVKVLDKKHTRHKNK